MKILRLLAPAFILFSFFSPASTGQGIEFPALKGYRTVNDYPVYTPDDLWDYINGAADAYLSLGFTDLHINEYVKGKNTIKAEAYRFSSDAEAFGIYSLERSPGYDFISTGVQGYTEEGILNFYKGEYYIKLMTHSKSKKENESMRVLGDMIADKIPGRNEFPELLGAFPAEGLLKNEETYLLDGVLGHDYLRGAFRASYETGGDRFYIYIFNCKSSGEAAEIAGRLTETQVSTAADETEKYVVTDGFNGVLYAARKGNRLIIISGLDRDKTLLAEKYLNMVLNR
jgi:hypothetical protein